MNTPRLRTFVVAGAAAATLALAGHVPVSATSAPPSAPSGSAAPSAGAAIVSTGACSICELLTDANGMTLYAFEKDPAGQSTCTGDCATEWPPLFVAGGAVPAVGDLDPSLFSLVDNPGGQVLAINGHALYTFADDKAPGDVTGQDKDGFYAVTPEGNLIGYSEGDEGDTGATEASS